LGYKRVKLVTIRVKKTPDLFGGFRFFLYLCSVIPELTRELFSLFIHHVKTQIYGNKKD